jgi:soluble lytic murein transglycosylase
VTACLTFAPGAMSRADARTDLDALARQRGQAGCAAILPALEAQISETTLEARRAAFLAGTCLLQSQRHAEAARAFQTAAGHQTLRDYARVGEARASANAGRQAAAVRLAREVAAGLPDGRLMKGRALMAVAEAEMASGNHAAALDAARGGAQNRPRDIEAWILVGRVAAAARRQSVALRAYARAAWAFPGDAREDDARAAMERLLGRPTTAADVDPESRLRRGARLLQLGEWDQAEVEFRAVTTAVRTGPVAAEAWYRLGEYRLGVDARGAHAAFQRAAALGWNAAAALYWAEQTARWSRQPQAAREAAAALQRVAPNSAWMSRYWYDAGLRAENTGRTADAAAAYRRSADVNPASDAAPEARWRLGWVALRSGRADDAAARFRRAGEMAPWRSEGARGWYWAAKSLEAMGGGAQTTEARRLIRLVAERYPYTFYGQRARARLGAAMPSFPPTVPHAIAVDAPGPAHEELARLGLYADAAEAGEDAIAARNDPRIARFLAEMHSRLGDIPRSVRYADDALSRGVRDEGTWRLAYPKAYWAEVTAAAQQAGVEPLLLIALVREESRYDAVVLSHARAIGLTQLLVGTARATANDPTLTVQRIKDPAVNLTIGARYLRQQLDRFGGDPRLALAAYNAGPGAAARWVNIDPDPDFFIERIGFSETRAYVRRVLGTYGVYRALYP